MMMVDDNVNDDGGVDFDDVDDDEIDDDINDDNVNDDLIDGDVEENVEFFKKEERRRKREEHAREVEADASFISNVLEHSNDKTISNSNSNVSSGGLESTSNMLRMHQVKELLEECRITESTTWFHNHQTQWIQYLSHLVQRFAIHHDQNTNSSIINQWKKDCPFVLQSDLFQQQQQQQMPKRSLKGLSLVPSFSHALTMTKPCGNANVLPTLTCVVVIPNSFWESNNNKKNHDFMHFRYMDQRNLILWCLAKFIQKQLQLNQNRDNDDQQAHDGGTLQYRPHWNARFGTPSLLLTHAVKKSSSREQNNNNNKSTKKKKKNKKRNRQQQDNHGDASSGPSPPRALSKPIYRIEIVMGMESTDWIPLPRLFPNRSNLRQSSSSSSSSTKQPYRSTPMYTSTLLRDAYMYKPLFHQNDNNNNISFTPTTYHKILAQVQQEYPHLQDALILCKIWCLQRGFFRAHNGLDETSLVALIHHLYQTHQVTNVRISSWTVFVLFLKCLARWHSQDKDNNNNDKKQLFVTPNHEKTTTTTNSWNRLEQQYQDLRKNAPLDTSSSKDPKTLTECFTIHHANIPILLDTHLHGLYNCLFQLSPTMAHAMARQARLTLNTSQYSGGLEDGVLQRALLQPMRFFSCMDVYMHIPLPPKNNNNTNNKKKKKNLMLETASKRLWECTLLQPHLQSTRDLGGPVDLMCRALEHILTMGLKDRIVEMRFLSTGNGDAKQRGRQNNEDSDQIPTFDMTTNQQDNNKNDNYKSPTGQNYIVVGLKLNSDNCHRVVDRAPPAASGGDANNNATAIERFCKLWGKKYAQLRRFKDGSIVHAVVWDVENTPKDIDNDNYVWIQHDDVLQGGIVERIIRHLFKLHFSNDVPLGEFQLSRMLSFVEGPERRRHNNNNSSKSLGMTCTSATVAHRKLIHAFDCLSNFLKTQSRRSDNNNNSSISNNTGNDSLLDLPLAIQDVQPLCPSLRYCSPIPPLPHAMLMPKSSTSSSLFSQSTFVSGVISYPPILIQVGLEKSLQWPTSNSAAMESAKTAMLIQLAGGLERAGNAANKRPTIGNIQNDLLLFAGPVKVYPGYLECGYAGYCWRMVLKVNCPAIHNDDDAIWDARVRHETFLHALCTKHATLGPTIRLVHIWLATHLLSLQIPIAIVELLAAHVYTNNNNSNDAPCSVMHGFIKVLHLLANHDWNRVPLIVASMDDKEENDDDEGNNLDSLTQHDLDKIGEIFQTERGPDYSEGPSMYIVSAVDCITRSKQQRQQEQQQQRSNDDDDDEQKWRPSLAISQDEIPERVVLRKVVALAQRSHYFLMQCLMSPPRQPSDDLWMSVFAESSASLMSYSALLRVHDDYLGATTMWKKPPQQRGSNKLFYPYSSTGMPHNSFHQIQGEGKTPKTETIYSLAVANQYNGPKAARIPVYRNLETNKHQDLLYNWIPVTEIVRELKRRFGTFAIFFYNHLCPEVIGILWRPDVVGQAQSFGAMNCEYTTLQQKDTTVVAVNVHDLMREIVHYTQHIVTTAKIFRHGHAGKATIVTIDTTTNTASEESENSEDSDDDDSSNVQDNDNDEEEDEDEDTDGR